MKTILDLEKDNLFDFFSQWNFIEFAELKEKNAKTSQERQVYNAIKDIILQIKQDELLKEKEKLRNGK